MIAEAKVTVHKAENLNSDDLDNTSNINFNIPKGTYMQVSLKSNISSVSYKLISSGIFIIQKMLYMA